ncbi:MAG: hypothetical protein KGI26_03995 [Thaumarchaeota archaeon]|nr:hypothetical protein [Nitrososphaerota archaeon]
MDDVLHDRRIDAVNVPELTRRHEGKQVRYSPVTIPPEEYALMIKEYKEAIVNVIAPRLPASEFLRRGRRILRDYGIPNLVVVGKERHGDDLPGPGVLEALEALSLEKGQHSALGGICIFDRASAHGGGYGSTRGRLTEPMRVAAKADAGCDFVTSQITFDAGPALGFLTSYQRLCEASGAKPATVFISLATIPSPSILALIESLDVVVPRDVRAALGRGPGMGRASVDISARVFLEILAGAEKQGVGIPLGLQVEQVGVNSGALALELLDQVAPSFA